MKLNSFLLILVFVLGTSVASAQRISSFPKENEAFMSALAGFMNDSRKKEGKDFIENEFAPVYLSPEMSVQKQIRIHKMCDLLLKNKMKAYPEFESYLLAVMAFQETDKTDGQFEEWDDFLTEFLDNKKLKKYRTEILASSASIFKNNVFFSSKSVSWKSSNSDYHFEFEDGIPKITFPSLNLICESKGDSSVIYNTQGVYYPKTEQWKGTQGRVNWLRADFDPESTYAEFENYEIRIKGSKYNVDSVLFYNEFFGDPLLGKLNEKVLADRSGENASYPRFESYDQRLIIEDIFKNIDYIGGFTMKGNKLAGTGTAEQPARIIVHREGEEFLISNSLEFSIRPDKISSQHASVKMILEEDSITHPDIILKYDENTRLLSMLKNDEGLSRGPYYNSYHQIDMYTEAMYWKIDDPLIELSTLKGSTQHYAAFESLDYYKELRYMALLGRADVHPLVLIKEFVDDWGSEEFPAYDLAKYMRRGEEQLEPMLIDLTNKGYIDYDMDTKMIRVQQKLYDTLYRNAGLKDYDVLSLNSDVTAGNNGQLNLLNNNMLIKGIRQIHLSDSQDVRIIPSNGEVIMKKNRDFKFGGRVWAGNFEFIGKDYLFNYEDFKIDLLQVDSCRIYVEDLDARPDQYGNRPKLRIKNVLEDIAGTLKIDSPTNKSGVQSEDYPGYPILESTKNTYVYYDNKNIQGGVYDRDRFYYQIEPFTIDSLDNFSRKDLSFNGTLISGGIFPDIKEPLGLMDDLSLGFDKSTGGSGLPLYGGKGKFTTDLTLNYDGLHGAGELNYLTTYANSDYFVFFPDSTKGVTQTYENRGNPGKPQVPDVKSDVTNLSFYPTQDLLAVSSMDTSLTFFNQEAELTGTTFLTPQGMTGKGSMEFEEAELLSEGFKYEYRKILADTSDFKLAQDGSATLAFKTNNVNAMIDFDDRIGEFKSNSGETTVEFPTNEYICYMDEFKWFMDKAEMDLKSNRTVSSDLVIDTEGEKAFSNFFSVNATQDSLNFLAPKAKYDIKNSILRCNEIKFITVADSKITPDSGKVVIHKHARMETLKNATLVTNYITQFHNIFNAEVDIKGRLDYEGSGDIVYVDELKQQQIIHMNKLYVDSLTQTIGEGKIIEDDEFSLSPYFDFQGDFTLLANKPNLTFDGGTRLLHTCENLERNWFKFEAEIDPLNIYIPVDTNLRDISMSKLGVGVIISDDSPIELYSTFLSSKKDRSDAGLIEALGYLHYDKNGKKYQIGSKEKIQQPDFPGNLIELDTESCEINGDGTIDMQVDFGLMTLKNIGEVKNNTYTGETNISGVSIIDFPFDDATMKHIVEQIQLWPDLNPMNISKTKYEKSIMELVDKKTSDKLISDLNLTGQFKKVPDELNNTIFFGDVKYEWDPLNDSYVSVGALGIATMGKKQIFKYIKGKIEVEKGRSGDIIRLYLELDPANWYYFEYRDATNLMYITTTDKAMIELVQKVKDDDRKFKEDKKTFVYQLLSSKKKRNDFVDRFSEFD